MRGPCQVGTFPSKELVPGASGSHKRHSLGLGAVVTSRLLNSVVTASGKGPGSCLVHREAGMCSAAKCFGTDCCTALTAAEGWARQWGKRPLNVPGYSSGLTSPVVTLDPCPFLTPCLALSCGVSGGAAGVSLGIPLAHLERGGGCSSLECYPAAAFPFKVTAGQAASISGSP